MARGSFIDRFVDLLVYVPDEVFNLHCTRFGKNVDKRFAVLVEPSSIFFALLQERFIEEKQLQREFYSAKSY